MFMKNGNVVTICEMLGFSSLGHDITHIGYLGLGFKDGFPNLIDHQIRKDRGKERTRTQDNHITFKNSFHHFLTSFWTLLIKGIGHINMINHAGVVGNVAFSYHFFSILKNGMKGQGTITGRIDLAGRMKEFG